MGCFLLKAKRGTWNRMTCLIRVPNPFMEWLELRQDNWFRDCPNTTSVEFHNFTCSVDSTPQGIRWGSCTRCTFLLESGMTSPHHPCTEMKVWCFWCGCLGNELVCWRQSWVVAHRCGRYLVLFWSNNMSDDLLRGTQVNNSQVICEARSVQPSFNTIKACQKPLTCTLCGKFFCLVTLEKKIYLWWNNEMDEIIKSNPCSSTNVLLGCARIRPGNLDLQHWLDTTWLKQRHGMT